MRERIDSMIPVQDHPWWGLPPEAVAELLDSESTGLSEEEAQRRLEHFGPNIVRTDEGESWWELMLHQFKDPLIYILLVAAAVTLAIQDYLDAGVILAVVGLNAIIGFVQEYRAQQAMLALARLGAPRAEVLRDGRTRQLPTAELVPGDVVLLTSGARVPADLRLVKTVGLEVDESALTGESVPVRKTPEQLVKGTPVAGDQVNLAFAGTVVSRGRGQGMVVRTGSHTEVGRIAEAVHEAAFTQTPLQENVRDFGAKVGFALVGLASVAAALGYLQGLTVTEIFMTAVAMAVSAVPEGLPVVLTVTLAVGVRRMAGRKAIIRKLPAVETLGSTTVIASDKTGTLTRNEMTVRSVWTEGQGYRVTGGGYGSEGEFIPLENSDPVGDFTDVGLQGEPGYSPLQSEATGDARHAPLRETLRAGVLASEADARILGGEGEPLGDPTEVALLVAAAKAGLAPDAVRAKAPEVALLPFEPELQFMATLVKRPGAQESWPSESQEGSPSLAHEALPPGSRQANRIYLKGAPEAVLARCTHILTSGGPRPLADGTEGSAMVRTASEVMAGSGLRVLAMAYRDTDLESFGDPSQDLQRMVLCGLQGMEDPVRPEAVAAVADLKKAGIRVIMITGDHLHTARAIGAQLGLGGTDQRAVEGKEMDDLSDARLDAMLGEGIQVFARVAPEHKLRIVQRLRGMGEVVAVTGDGVNDAPALRAAHLGIAMGLSGTDVAREASDMVLQDDNFATIRGAVEEGRVVFANVRKVTFFLLSTAVGEVITILVALAAGWPLPFVAAQILWINLVTNGLQDVALAVEPGEPGLLDRKPRPSKEGILPWRLLERLGGVGLVLAAGTLATFWWTWDATGNLDEARTVAMTQMVVFQFFHVFNCRSLDRSIFRIDPFSNRFLFVSLAGALAAQLAVLYWGPLQTVFRTVPLGWEQWGVIVAVGSTVILGGELDKLWNRRRIRPLG